MMVAEIFIQLVGRFRQSGKFAKAHITQGRLEQRLWLYRSGARQVSDLPYAPVQILGSSTPQSIN